MTKRGTILIYLILVLFFTNFIFAVDAPKYQNLYAKSNDNGNYEASFVNCADGVSVLPSAPAGFGSRY